MKYILTLPLFDGFEGYFYEHIFVECNPNEIEEGCQKLTAHMEQKDERPYLEGDIQIHTLDEFLKGIKADETLLKIMGISNEL
jgi:hypothetical protein